MVSSDLRRGREKRAESAQKFRSETIALHQARRESAMRFAVGQLVTDGKHRGKITDINRQTGETFVKFGLRVITVDPRSLEPT